MQGLTSSPFAAEIAMALSWT